MSESLDIPSPEVDAIVRAWRALGCGGLDKAMMDLSDPEDTYYMAQVALDAIDREEVMNEKQALSQAVLELDGEPAQRSTADSAAQWLIDRLDKLGYTLIHKSDLASLKTHYDAKVRDQDEKEYRAGPREFGVDI